MPRSVCQWKPFCIPIGGSFKRPSWRSGSSSVGDSSDGQNVMDFPVLYSTDHADCILEMRPTKSKQFDSLPWEPARP